jgi:hypothetical protein
VPVGRERASESEAICARLLLGDAPLRPFPLLDALQVVHELGPLDAGLAFDQTGIRVEVEDPVHPRHVNVPAVREELLATHGMAGAGDADRTVGLAGGVDHCLEVGERGRPVERAGPGRIEA